MVFKYANCLKHGHGCGVWKTVWFSGVAQVLTFEVFSAEMPAFSARLNGVGRCIFEDLFGVKTVDSNHVRLCEGCDAG